MQHGYVVGDWAIGRHTDQGRSLGRYHVFRRRSLRPLYVWLSWPDIAQVNDMTLFLMIWTIFNFPPVLSLIDWVNGLYWWPELFSPCRESSVSILTAGLYHLWNSLTKQLTVWIFNAQIIRCIC
jgi:hypothetical protein